MSSLDTLRSQAKKAVPKGHRLNAKGRKKFPIAILDSLGIDTIDKLHTEMMLIEQRKSRRSSAQRRAIVHVFFNVELLNQVRKE
jgi:hypothetical protein